MTEHLIPLPVLIPLLAGVLLLLPPCHRSVTFRRIVSIGLSLSTLLVAAWLMVQGTVLGPQVYAIGDWPAPWGIVLVADRVSVLLVTLNGLLGFFTITYASQGDDENGMFFHPLMHFLIAGVNGAFLTGDLFNLFVFFEVLLIASYALLMHGGKRDNTKAAFHYVVLNLVGSSVFLMGLAILYGVLGTLNMADMADKVSLLQGNDLYLARIGVFLLMIVFGLKAALLPLHLWLPRTYAAALPVVGAMFAIMTKVGVYAILRVFTVILSRQPDLLAGGVADWLWPLGLLTMLMGAMGVMASRDLRRLTAHIIIVSVGALVAAISLQTVTATAAVLYYLVHSTLTGAALFLLADVIGQQRGSIRDRLVVEGCSCQPLLLGGGFLVAALAAIGMPPLSGFVGKIWLLRAAFEADAALIFWPVFLVAGLAVLVALSRAGTCLFQTCGETGARQVGGALRRVPPLKAAVIISLLACLPLMVVFGGALSSYTQAAAQQIHGVPELIDAVLGTGTGGM